MKITRKKLVSFISKNSSAAGLTKAAAGVVSLALFAGGAGAVLSQFQAGNAFNPGDSLTQRALKANHVMFSEGDTNGDSVDSDTVDEDAKQGSNSAGDVEDVNEVKRPYNQNERFEQRSSLYDMSQNVLVSENQSADGSNTAEKLKGKNVQVYEPADGNDSEHVENLLSADNLENGNSSSDKINNSGSHGSGNGSSDSGNSGSQSEKDGNDDSTAPTPEPTPTPNPDPEPTPNPDKNTDADHGIEDPDYPSGSDGPKLPEITDPVLVKPAYKEGTGSDVETKDIQLIAVPAMPSDDGVVLYNGAILTDWKLLCASYVWVQLGDDRYRLTEYSDYFKIGDHPNIADGKLKVKFYFRQRTDIPWDEAVTTECEYDVKYAKVLLLGESDAYGNRSVINTFYMEDADKPILAAEQISNILESEKSTSEVENIIPGVSFSIDGTNPIYDRTYLKKGGRYTIYPLARVPVPAGMEVMHTYGWYDDESAYIKRQMLVQFGNDQPEVVSETDPEVETDTEDEIGTDTETDVETDTTPEIDIESETDAESSSEIVSVPEGIYGISDGLMESNADILKIPSSVHEIDIPARYVKNGYIVSDTNLNFEAEDGVLFKSDLTEILSVPWFKEELVVPESVEKINIEPGNSIKKLVLNCKKVPMMDLSALGEVQIVVPDDLYQEYLLAWGSSLGESTLTRENGESDQTYTENNGIFSLDKETLYGITKDARGLYHIPDSVRTIKSGTTDYCTLEEGIYISSDIDVLESESLSGKGINRVYFACDNPPDIEEDTFGDLEYAVGNRKLQILVPEDKRDIWIEKWSPVIGLEYAEKLIVGTTVLSLVQYDNELSYIETDDGMTLLKAPGSVESFSELEECIKESDITDVTLKWYRIGSYAFDGCSNLQVVELPETVAQIGSKAFSNCKNLELVLVRSKETVDLGKKVFSNGTTVAFNATVLNVGESKMPANITMYVTNGCEINIDEDASELCSAGDEYTLVSAGKKGTLLYGLESEKNAADEENDSNSSEGEKIAYLIKATHDIEGEILPPEGYSLKQIISEAFEDCLESFYIEPEASMEIEAIGDRAFLNSGISGEVILSKTCFLIGEEAFRSCSDLTQIIFTDSSDKAENLSVNGGAFYGSGLEEIVFEDNLYELFLDIFAECDNLKSVTFAGEIPPRITCYTNGIPYHFGWEDSGLTPVIKISNGDPKDYALEWQYPMAGYGSLEDMEDEAWFDAITEIFWNLSEDQIYDEDGDIRSNIYDYIEDYIEAWTQIECYKGMLRACDVLGVSEPVDPEISLPVLDDYVDEIAEEITPYELVEVEEIEITDQSELDEEFLIDMDVDTDSDEEEDSLDDMADNEDVTGKVEDEQDSADNSDDEKPDEKQPDKVQSDKVHSDDDMTDSKQENAEEQNSGKSDAEKPNDTEKYDTEKIVEDEVESEQSSDKKHETNQKSSQHSEALEETAEDGKTAENEKMAENEKIAQKEQMTQGDKNEKETDENELGGNA